VRKSLEESWRYLESQGEEPPRRPNGRPLVSEAMPNFDDEELRFSYYKYRQDFLSDEQQAVMAWSEDEGPDPPGG
jgi:hypothetical protein